MVEGNDAVRLGRVSIGIGVLGFLAACYAAYLWFSGKAHSG